MTKVCFIQIQGIKHRFSISNSNRFSPPESALPLSALAQSILPSPYPDMPEIQVNEPGILKLLQNLKPHKAEGPDNIKPIILKQLAIEIAPILTFIQTCQLSRVSRESHGFLHFLQSHGRVNSCSRVYSCPTVLFSHRLLPIIIAGNTFWQHKFSVK